MARNVLRFLLLTFILSLQGSLYETSNLDRGGSNRKKKIEEFSRSSREKLVQSKNKMFSKFTSILQHAVEAVSFFVLFILKACICPLACCGVSSVLVEKGLWSPGHIITSALGLRC